MMCKYIEQNTVLSKHGSIMLRRHRYVKLSKCGYIYFSGYYYFSRSFNRGRHGTY